MHSPLALGILYATTHTLYYRIMGTVVYTVHEFLSDTVCTNLSDK